MPSIGDIANEAKALLEKIDINTSATKVNTASTDNHVVQLISVTQAGFVNLSQGMAVQIALQKQTNELLELNARQNETMICWLKNIAEELCVVVHNTAKEVQLQQQLNSTLTHLDKVLELANAREAMEVERRDEIEARLEKCCPQLPEPVVPCFVACKAVEVPPFRPITTKWEPLKQRDNQPK